MKNQKVRDGDFEFEVEDVLECTLCNSDLDKNSGVIVESSLDIRTQYQILQCDSCGLGHSQPRPTGASIGLLYESKNEYPAMLSRRDFDPDSSKSFSKVKDFVAKREIRNRLESLSVSSVVDYGAGNGRYSNQIKSLTGGDVCAVDYQDSRPAQLREDVKYLIVDQFFSQLNTYDVIFLRHVLEHADDPVDLLRSLSAKLNVGGRIYLEVPNFNSTLRKIFKQSWVGNYLPRHIHHFTPESLQIAILNSGLNGEVELANMPLMGNQLARLLHARNYSLPFKLIGVVLHPLQVLIEVVNHSSTVLRATVRSNQ